MKIIGFEQGHAENAGVSWENRWKEILPAGYAQRGPSRLPYYPSSVFSLIIFIVKEIKIVGQLESLIASLTPHNSTCCCGNYKPELDREYTKRRESRLY